MPDILINTHLHLVVNNSQFAQQIIIIIIIVIKKNEICSWAGKSADRHILNNCLRFANRFGGKSGRPRALFASEAVSIVPRVQANNASHTGVLVTETPPSTTTNRKRMEKKKSTSFVPREKWNYRGNEIISNGISFLCVSRVCCGKYLWQQYIHPHRYQSMLF